MPAEILTSDSAQKLPTPNLFQRLLNTLLNLLKVCMKLFDLQGRENVLKKTVSKKGKTSDLCLNTLRPRVPWK